MNFDPACDNIAIVLSALKLRKSSDGLDKYNEPYIVVLAMDEHDAGNTRLAYQLKEFHNVKAYEQIILAGDGVMLYGPANPGSFVTLSVMVMESDEDFKAVGAQIDSVITRLNAGLPTTNVAKMQPGVAAAEMILQTALGELADVLSGNKDDYLLTVSGTWLRDTPTPYKIGSFSTHHNDFAEATLKVVPLIQRPPKQSSPEKWRVS
ncbi:hypothetical protein MUA03_10855 [Enterobacteriaceae bacterium H16N7]|nr:hypothetical protein [Dryocola clanedunensis]